MNADFPAMFFEGVVQHPRAGLVPGFQAVMRKNENIFRVLPWLRRYPGMAFVQLACAVLGTLMVLVPRALLRRF